MGGNPSDALVVIEVKGNKDGFLHVDRNDDGLMVLAAVASPAPGGVEVHGQGEQKDDEDGEANSDPAVLGDWLQQGVEVGIVRVRHCGFLVSGVVDGCFG